MNVFFRRTVDSQSLMPTLSYELTLMEFTDNVPKPPDFFSIQAVTKDELTCLNEYSIKHLRVDSRVDSKHFS
jgi:hypothetical protein